MTVTGIALLFGVDERQGVMVTVGFLILSSSIHCHPHLSGKALYAADKLAHEEAICNGGVS